MAVATFGQNLTKNRLSLIRSVSAVLRPEAPLKTCKRYRHVSEFDRQDRCHDPQRRKELDNCCPNYTCKPKPRRGFFGKIFDLCCGCKERPPLKTCRRKYLHDRKNCPIDPDLSPFGGKPFKTCTYGTYVIQHKDLPAYEGNLTSEDYRIKKMEAPVGNKHLIADPMPSFRSAEQRYLDLQDRKLHPNYKRFEGLRKKKPSKFMKDLYKRYASIDLDKIVAEDIPKKIIFNRNLLEKKNMYAEFKRVDPPKHLIGKIVELQKNRQLAEDLHEMRKKYKETIRDPVEYPKEAKTFDSLHQKG